jgi:class 3 adenylate cyclase
LAGVRLSGASIAALVRGKADDGCMWGAGVETVTILITDLVGSTQLESRVGPIVAEQLREEHFGLLRDAIGDAGGREVKNTGDGLMVVFESAAGAVSCAVSIQRRFERRNRSAAEPLLIKAGVSAGDASTAEGDVFGMPVIEAARLCDGCSAGQILAKELVAHLAAGRGHAFVSVGALELKGLPEPISAIEVQWETAPVTGIALPERLRELPATEYVGRVAERERLTQLWMQAQTGSLRLALIAGEAGVGKTRLSTHVALQLHGEGATVLYGRCEEDLGVPFQPWVQALGHLVKESSQRVLDAQVGRFGGDLARLVPALSDRVPDLPAPRESDLETERYPLYAAVAGLLEEAGKQEPLLLILDDLHWADAPTLLLLRHVVTAGSSMAVMVAATYRDSDLSRDHPLAALLADLHREQGVERLKLIGLDPEDVVALMEALAGHKLDEDGRELALEITHETDGNPFFAGELLRHLIESGAIAKGPDGHWELRPSIADLGLPQSVREVVSRRVERLGEQSQQILTMAAVIGRTFDFELLGLLVDGNQEELLDALEGAARASLLVESLERVGRFSFAHALISHALYDTLGATRRALLHRRVAEALEELCAEAPGERLVAEFSEAIGSAGGSASILAYHSREAGNLDRTVHFLLMAAERAGRGGAEAEAVTLYNQALDLIPEDDAARRRDVRLKRAIVYARFTHAAGGDASGSS